MSAPTSGPSIQSLTRRDLAKLKEFTDREIGAGYYSMEELEDILKRSEAIGHDGKPHMCSLVLKQGDEILGVRISFPPGKWQHGKGEGENHGIHPGKWPHPLSETGYFQSLFVSDKVQGHGWGPKLSYASLRVLADAGAKGVVCHSWKQSPHNSSFRYLDKMGFKVIAEHPLYWSKIDYRCTVCGDPPCQCTAIEMYREINSQESL